MLIINIENHKGEVLGITQNPAYTIMSVTGLNPAAANVNTVDAALLDGATFNSSKVGIRNIVINFVIENPAEANRIELYRYIKPKKPCTVYVKNGSRDVFIAGYIETLDIDLFDNKQTAQISIICPQPFFLDVETETVEFLRTGNAENDGDVEIGALITITAVGGALTNPSITNAETGDLFKINHIIPEGASLIINTNRGQKSVMLISGGTTTNLINYVDHTSTWLQLDTGVNNLVCDADTGAENLSCSISYNLKFEGV